MRALFLAAIAAVAACAPTEDGSSGAAYMATCYYGSWAVYRPGQGKFDVENIDPMLCTHAIYGFAGLDEATNKIKSLDPYNDLYDDYGKGAFLRFTNMKKRNPALKTILAIGGWNEGSTKYSKMARDPAARATFVQSCVEFVKKYNFDGLDLDWEYPAERGGDKIDRDDYVALIKELKEAFAPEGLLVSAAVGPGKATIDDSYRLDEVGKYLDIVNVMAYDYHGAWDPFTGHVAPLYNSPLDFEQGYGSFTANFTVSYYLAGGVPAEKIAMGIPLYGHGFRLDDPAQHGLYAPANQPQPACPFTQQAGSCGFNEICTMLQEGGWTSVRDEDQHAVYSYKDHIWVGYDDPESIKLKTDYIKSMGLGGSMVWSIETDDFHDLCGYGTANPLMNAIWTNLNGDIPSPVTPPAPTGPTTTPGPTIAPQHVCKKAGLNPNPDQMCSPIFYDCVRSGDHWQVTREECADGTIFDRSMEACTWISQSPECQHMAHGIEA